MNKIGFWRAQVGKVIAATSRATLGAALALGLSGWLAAAPRQPDACIDCHKDEKFRVQNQKLYEYFQDWSGSAHDLAGLSCSSCHGGDPSASAKEAAHKGVLPQSDTESPFHYKNIPRTCGGCHPQVLASFQKSRHYEQLRASGRGPSCITCHGSLDTRVYAVTIVERSCAKCHSEKTRNHPEVIAQAQEILELLNHANGYRKGLKFYYRSINKPEAMAKVDQAYGDVIQFWHEFDFKKIRPRARDLLAELKTLYLSAHGERQGEPGPSSR